MKRIILFAALTLISCSTFASVSFADGYDDKKDEITITKDEVTNAVALDVVSYDVDNYATISVFAFSPSKDAFFPVVGGVYTVSFKAAFLPERDIPPNCLTS